MSLLKERSVLLVEDDDTLQAAVQYNLSREGYNVLTAGDGERAVEMARRHRPKVIVLDLMLPRMDGLEVCRMLRREMTSPILMLTAWDREIDKVSGLDVGADDYMTKPFSMRELMARVKAMMRRAEMEPPQNNVPEAVSVEGLNLDLKARTAKLEGKPLEMKPKEYDLLAFLATHPGKAFTRNELLDQVWGYDFVGYTRTVDVHVRWLREKIELEPGSPRRIVTVRGTGYRYDI
ncbi:MAG: response regulator transcription factor [SAR202 cluster bacterium]|nr:response regulator transcription factor [SAR202 cluster bacterium]